MSGLFFPQLFEHSRKINRYLKGDIAEIDEDCIHVDRENLVYFKSLLEDLERLHPEAGKSYWKIRLWTLLCWQPIYLAFISIYGFKTLPNIHQIGQIPKIAMISGFRFPDEQHIHGEVDELIILAGEQLQQLFNAYQLEINQLTKLQPALAQQLLADGVLGCLLLLKKRYPDLENRYIQQQAKLWLQSCGLPEKFQQHVYERRNNKLAFIRIGCCLVYKCKRKKHCKNCPKKAKNKKQLKLIKQSQDKKNV